MEQYFQDFKNYGTAGTCANGTNAPAWNTFAPGGAKYFTFTCVQAVTDGVEGYKLTATGNTGMAVGHIYTVDQNNTQQTTKFKGNVVSGKSCWLLSGSEC